MRAAVAHDRTPEAVTDWVRQRDRIGRRPGGDEIDGNVMLEEIGELCLKAAGDVVIAIAKLVAGLTCASAARISGATPAALSLAKFMHVFARVGGRRATPLLQKEGLAVGTRHAMPTAGKKMIERFKIGCG